MRCIMTGSKRALVALPLLLIGCAAKPEIKVEHEFVPVPVIVATGCIASTGRPATVTPLNKSTGSEHWQHLAPGAKAEAVRAQAGKRMNYEDGDRAATSGCK